MIGVFASVGMKQKGIGRIVCPERDSGKKCYNKVFSTVWQNCFCLYSQTPDASKTTVAHKAIFLYHQAVMLDSSYYIPGVIIFMTSAEMFS